MNKKMKLGLHTYTLHLWGLGQNWGRRGGSAPQGDDPDSIDGQGRWNGAWSGLHITGCDLETKDDKRLAQVKSAAQAHNLYLEYNFSDGTRNSIRV